MVIFLNWFFFWGVYAQNIVLGTPPPPPPPPPLTKPMITAPPTLIVPLRKQIQHYPQVKLKNFQWKKMDASAAENTIWNIEIGEDDEFMQEALKEQGAFEKIEALFPAKVNTFLEKRLAQTNTKAAVKNDSVKFLSKDKNRNISKFINCIEESVTNRFFFF